jgi:hypothetical protein
MDRLARNLDDLRRIVQDLTRRGVRIEFVKEGLTGSVAEFERTTANSTWCTEPRPHILWLPETLQQSRLDCFGAVRVVDGHKRTKWP